MTNIDSRATKKAPRKERHINRL